MSGGGTVYVVDDDTVVRQSLRLLLESEGFDVVDFDGASTFLEWCDENARGCLISDIHMPGLSGLELQQALSERGIALPLIMLTGQADVPAAVQSLKAGAVDFIEKPFDPPTLIAQVSRALALDAERSAAHRERERRESLLARLTPREREVVERVAAGQSNKVVALDLDISERTVELHRARGMRKLEVRAVADLVRLLGGADPLAGRRARTAPSRRPHTPFRRLIHVKVHSPGMRCTPRRVAVLESLMGLAALIQVDDLQPQRIERARVYVVDDDSAVRAAVSMLVRTGGWDAVPCEHVEDFLTRYTPGVAQCLVIDIHMPGRSGLDLQRELRQRGDPLPVIVVTAHHELPEVRQARALGAHGVLGKPFNDGELLGLISEALAEA